MAQAGEAGQGGGLAGSAGGWAVQLSQGRTTTRNRGRLACVTPTKATVPREASLCEASQGRGLAVDSLEPGGTTALVLTSPARPIGASCRCHDGERTQPRREMDDKDPPPLVTTSTSATAAASISNSVAMLEDGWHRQAVRNTSFTAHVGERSSC
eukprot:7393415-Pyramimonas_sp.AAC.1